MSDPARKSGARTAPGRQARSAARLATVQALYQIEFGGQSPERVIDEFLRLRYGPGGEHAGEAIDGDYFRRLVLGAAAARERADVMIADSMTGDWTLDRIDPTLRATLRAGIFELLDCAEVPVAVVISEYVDIADAFHAGREPAFVNGVLDRIARDVRAGEFAQSGTEADDA